MLHFNRTTVFSHPAATADVRAPIPAGWEATVPCALYPSPQTDLLGARIEAEKIEERHEEKRFE
jgi:hypothetical protein